MTNLFKTFFLSIVLTAAFAGLSGCKDKQEVAQEQSKEALKKMFSKPPQMRTYNEILKEELAKSGKSPKSPEKKETEK